MHIKLNNEKLERPVGSIVLKIGEAKYFIVENDNGVVSLCKRVPEIMGDDCKLKIIRKTENIVEIK